PLANRGWFADIMERRDPGAQHERRGAAQAGEESASRRGLTGRVSLFRRISRPLVEGSGAMTRKGARRPRCLLIANFKRDQTTSSRAEPPCHPASRQAAQGTSTQISPLISSSVNVPSAATKPWKNSPPVA